MAGITTRPIPVNYPVLITPRLKTQLLSALRDLILRDFIVPRSQVHRVTAAVAKALASPAQRSNVGPPLYMLRTTHGDIVRVVRLELVSIEREEGNRKEREQQLEENLRREREREQQRERAAAASLMGGDDIDDGWPRPPTATGHRRAQAMQTRECISQMRALPSGDVDDLASMLEDLVGDSSPASVRSLAEWSRVAGREGAGAWLSGFLQPTEDESVMAEALRDMRRAEHEAAMARARLAGASRSYGLLSGSRSGGARSIGMSVSALNSLCEPDAFHRRQRSPRPMRPE